MKLYRIHLDLPSFYPYPEPDREAVSLAFRDDVKSWLQSIPSVGIESWKENRYYGHDIIVCDDQRLGDVLCGTHRFTEHKASPNSEEGSSFVVSKVELFYDRERVEDKMLYLLERMELAAHRLESGEPDRNPANPGWNTHTNGPISGFHLHNANELMLCNDCCTDELQGHIDDGWRIIAVTTQEQRRPDYILARYNNTYNSERGKALRG